MPIYEQIESSIENAIVHNLLIHQCQLPTEKEISDFYNISIGSVKRALINLENRNLIYRIKGKGSFVNNRPQQIVTFDQLKLGSVTPFNFYSALVEKKKKDKFEFTELTKFNCVNLYHIIRIYYDQVFSLMVEESYIAEKAFKYMEYELLKENSISEIISKHSLTHLKMQTNSLNAEKADSKMAKIFAIKIADPITTITSIFYNDQNEVVAIVIRRVPSEYTLLESEA